MRNQFIQLLCTWAREDETIYLLTADLGFSVLEPFSQEFPKRFINVGIAEQNMIGIAAGLSLRGKKVFVYSIVNFGTLRCLEQIRNDICYHNVFSGTVTLSVVACILMPAFELFMVGNSSCNCYYLFKKSLLEF